MSSWLKILFFSLMVVVQIACVIQVEASNADTSKDKLLKTKNTTEHQDGISIIENQIDPEIEHLETSFSWGGYFQAIGIMCILLAVLWGAVWMVRRYGKFNFIPSPTSLPRDALQMEGQLPLGPKKGLVVIRFLDRRLLLGLTEQNIILLKDTGLHDERDTQEFERLLNGVGQHDSENI